MAAFERHYHPDTPTTRHATMHLNHPRHRDVTCITLDSAIDATGWCWPHDIDDDCTTEYQDVHGALLEEKVPFERARFVYDLESDDWWEGDYEAWSIHIPGPRRVETLVYALRDRCGYSVTVVEHEAPVLGAAA